MRHHALFLLPLLLAGCWSAGGLDSVAWEPPKAATMQPDLALERASLREAGPMPEDVAVDPSDPQRLIYAGLDDGRIVRIGEDGRVETFARVPGTPLGLKFGADHTLYACVSGHGLVAVAPDGTVRDLATAVDGKPLVFPNDLDV